jgi:hypothetical protein
MTSPCKTTSSRRRILHLRGGLQSLRGEPSRWFQRHRHLLLRQCFQQSSVRLRRLLRRLVSTRPANRRMATPGEPSARNRGHLDASKPTYQGPRLQLIRLLGSRLSAAARASTGERPVSASRRRSTAPDALGVEDDLALEQVARQRLELVVLDQHHNHVGIRDCVCCSLQPHIVHGRQLSW